MSVRKINLVVLRDLDAARAAIERAAATAPEPERPGLRRALEVLDGLVDSDDEAMKVRWAREYLAAAGVAGDAAGTQSIRALRRAVPGLGLADAVELVTLAAG